MSADDLSGRWQGIFNYPRDVPPIGFAAMLYDIDGALTGETVEPAPDGRTLAAQLDGRRRGSSVTFAKLYNANDGDYDAVAYDGTVAADGQEITGRWSIPGIWSGTFIMVREKGIGTPTETEAATDVESR